MESFTLVDWGLIPYDKAYHQQQQIFEKALNNKLNQQQVENNLIFCEHPHVITVGKSGKYENLLYPETFLNKKGVAFYPVDRGGDMTYHGPGQLVGYPIFDLEFFKLGLKKYIDCLEDAIILLLAEYGISGMRMPGATGVWLDANEKTKARKICAIGVRCSRYISMHGFALNVNTDLDYFQLINPCGFQDKGVTSIQKETGESINLPELKNNLLQIFKKIF